MVPRLHPVAAVVLALGLAVQGARASRRRIGTIRAWLRRTVSWVVLTCAVLGLCARLAPVVMASRTEARLPRPASGVPNVVLIVLDTVRATNLGLYGYARDTSPRLDRFARSGVVFDRALSTSPWTLPSHASFFTGRLPHELTANWQTPLDATFPTLAEVMAQRGYDTVGFVGNLLYATEHTGLSRGFVRYSDIPMSVGRIARDSWLVSSLLAPIRHALGPQRNALVRKSGTQVTDEFVDWLPSRPDRPFFAFLNYFDAHSPYRSIAPFATKFGGGGPVPDFTTRRSWSPEQIQESLDAYDGSVAFVDDQVGRVVDSLAAHGLLANTLVVVTSDHGEQFGEHGLFDHANSLYRPLLQVPLVFSLPGRIPAGVRVAEPVSLLDLGATILDLTGGPDTATFPGQSLKMRWDASEATAASRPLLASVRKGINLPPWLPVSRGSMQSIIWNGMHYIRNDDGTEELYDFERDTGETENLAGRAPMRSILEDARRQVALMGNRR